MNQLPQQIQLAKQAYARREYTRAVQICDALLSSFGLRDDLLNIKAVSLLALGQVEAAEVSIRKAIKINPRIAGMHLNAAGIYKALSLNKKVKRHALDAVRLAPRDAVVLYQAALLCRDCGDYSQALRIIDRCLQVKPGFAQGWHLKGSALIDLGKTQASQEALEKAVELEPGNVRALSALAKIRGDRPDSSKMVGLLERIQSQAISAQDQASATFSLADMYRRDGQHDESFSLFLKANALAASSRPFDLEKWGQKNTNVIRSSSTAGTFSTSSRGSGSNLVFIVGMPRSGTTLCEQVLSANSKVLACGELTAMEKIESSFARRGFDPYQCDPDAKELVQAASLYLSALPRNHQEFQLVTDKAPMNFERLGLIQRMFPRARFLFCTRHPLDTIVSCFMQDFQAGLTFASSLEQITKVYIAHVQLMQHWMKLFPGQIYTVNYEQYIAGQDTETRKMAEFLGLDFEQSMLTPHQQERAVGTASNLQVRKAVYSSSVGRWKTYRTQLSEVALLLQKAGLLDDDLNSLL